MQINNNDVLSHHGVKGQKWGVRNYQYKDGSLTPKGKKRLGIGTVGAKLSKARKATAKKVSELHKKRVAKKELKKAEKEIKNAEKEVNAYRHKSAKDMNDEELSKAINRARMEDQYNALRPEPVSKGKAFINTIGGQVLKPALINSGKRALEKFLDKAVDDALKDKIDPDSLEGLKKTADKLRAKEEVDMLKKYGVSSWKDVRTKQQAEDHEENKNKAKAAETKAAEDAARKANEARSQAEYEKTNSQYSKTFTKSTADAGKSTVAGLLSGPIANKPANSYELGPVKKKGETLVTEVLDRYETHIVDGPNAHMWEED